MNLFQEIRRAFNRALYYLLHWLGAIFAGAVALLLTPTLWFGALRRSILSLAEQWSRSAKFRQLLLGIPALLTLGAFSYIAFAASTQSRTSLAEEYNHAATEALTAKNYQVARLCLQRIIQLRGENPETLLKLAQIYSAEEDYRHMGALMNRLAPIDKPTIPEAHIWRAQSILAKGQLTFAELDEVEQQLQNAIRLRPSDPMARSLLGQVMAQTGRLQEARVHFEKVPGLMPSDAMRLAEICAQLNDIPAARASANTALRQLRIKLLESPSNASVRSQVVSSLVFLEQFDEAVQVLNESPGQKDSVELAKQRARVYATWAEVIEHSNDRNVPRQIELVHLALQSDPDSLPAYDRLAQLIATADEQQLQRLRVMLQRMLITGRSAPLVHLCLGIDALLHDRHEEGVKHLEIAYESEQIMLPAANNLAWAFAFRDPANIKDALTLTENLIAKFPQVAAVRDTRGQVLAKASRWKEAIGELEFAIRELPNSRITRQTLIAAYKKIGLDEIAAQHQKILDEMDSATTVR